MTTYRHNRLTLQSCMALWLLTSTIASAETIYLHAARMIDVVNAEVIKNPIILIQGERIIKVADKQDIDIPEGAALIDLGDMTMLPGLIDMHTHITSKATEHGYKSLSVSIPRKAITGVKNAKTTLLAGITTIRDLGADGFADVALKDAINEGDVIGPRIFASGPGIGVTGGHCDNNLLPLQYNVVAKGVADGPWAARQKVRENIKYGADVIKICATGGVLSKGTKVGVQQYTFEEMKAIVDESHRRGLKVAAHAHGTSGIKDAIRAGVDSIEHASFMDKEAIKLAKEYGTYLSMDIYVTEYILSEGEKAGILAESIDKERKTGARQRKSFSDSLAAGVKIVFGTDAAVYPHGNNAKQLSRMVRFGMTQMQALQAATIEGAKLLDQTKNIGSLRVERYADIIAVKGNPIEDITTLEDVDFVMKGGLIYKNKSDLK